MPRACRSLATRRRLSCQPLVGALSWAALLLESLESAAADVMGAAAVCEERLADTALEAGVCDVGVVGDAMARLREDFATPSMLALLEALEDMDEEEEEEVRDQEKGGQKEKEGGTDKEGKGEEEGGGGAAGQDGGADAGSHAHDVLALQEAASAVMAAIEGFEGMDDMVIATCKQAAAAYQAQQAKAQAESANTAAIKAASGGTTMTTMQTCLACGVKKHQGLMVCGSCKQARFCDRDCQRKAWPSHKKDCRPPPPAAAQAPTTR